VGGAIVGLVVGAVGAAPGGLLLDTARVLAGTALGAVTGYSLSVLFSFGSSPIARYARPRERKEKP